MRKFCFQANVEVKKLRKNSYRNRNDGKYCSRVECDLAWATMVFPGNKQL